MSFIFTFIIAFLISLTFNSPSEIAAHIRQSRESVALDIIQAKRGINYFQTLQNLMIILGILGTFIGTMSILLRNITDKTTIGKGLGTALLTVAYSLVLSVLITQPFIGALKKKLAEKE